MDNQVLQEEQVNLYSMNQTTSQLYNEGGEDKQQLIRQLLDGNSLKQLEKDQKKRISQFEREIKVNTSGDNLKTSQQRQLSSSSNNRYSQQDQVQYQERAQNLRDQIQQQSRNNSFQNTSQIQQNQNNSYLSNNNNINGYASNVNASVTQQKEDQQISQQQIPQINYYEQEQFVDPRGSQRSEELYLKGLKSRIEQQGKVKQIKEDELQQQKMECTFSPVITRKAKKLNNYMDIVQKTEVHYIRKYEREQGRKMEIAEQEEDSCTFAPDFCKKSLMMQSPQSIKKRQGSQQYSHQPIYERQVEWQKKVQEKSQNRDRKRWDSICSQQSNSNSVVSTKRKSQGGSKSILRYKSPNSKNQNNSQMSFNGNLSQSNHLRKPQNNTFYNSHNNGQNNNNRSYSGIQSNSRYQSPLPQQQKYSQKHSQSYQQQPLQSQKSVQYENNNNSTSNQFINKTYDSQRNSPGKKLSNNLQENGAAGSDTVQDKLSKLLQPTSFGKNPRIQDAFSPIKNEIQDTLQLFNKIQKTLTQNNNNIQNYNSVNTINNSRNSNHHQQQKSGNRSNASSVSGQRQQPSRHNKVSQSPNIYTTNTLKPKSKKVVNGIQKQNNYNSIALAQNQQRKSYQNINSATSRSPNCRQSFSRQQQDQIFSQQKLQVTKNQKIGLDKNRYVFIQQNQKNSNSRRSSLSNSNGNRNTTTTKQFGKNISNATNKENIEKQNCNENGVNQNGQQQQQQQQQFVTDVFNSQTYTSSKNGSQQHISLSQNERLGMMSHNSSQQNKQKKTTNEELQNLLKMSANITQKISQIQQQQSQQF